VIGRMDDRVEPYNGNTAFSLYKVAPQLTFPFTQAAFTQAAFVMTRSSNARFHHMIADTLHGDSTRYVRRRMQQRVRRSFMRGVPIACPVKDWWRQIILADRMLCFCQHTVITTLHHTNHFQSCETVSERTTKSRGLVR
jgi:hypothetical protein